jgi:hypothetical protein
MRTYSSKTVINLLGEDGIKPRVTCLETNCIMLLSQVRDVESLALDMQYLDVKLLDPEVEGNILTGLEYIKTTLKELEFSRF